MLFGACGFSKGLVEADGLPYSEGGAYIVFHVRAPPTRATSLSPRRIRGLSWLLTDRRHKRSAPADRRHPRNAFNYRPL